MAVKSLSLSKLSATEVESRKKEIKGRAKRVYNISFDYHLTHAVFGSDGLLISDRMEEKSKAINELNQSLVDAARQNDNALIEKLMNDIKEKAKIKGRNYKILIDYSSMMKDPCGGRVITVGDQLNITLPEKLRKDLKNDDDKLIDENVQKIKKIMAHELGHIVLHTDFLSQDDLIGSSGLNDLDWEADEFAAELIRLFQAKSTAQKE
jgi:hypothetical protein